MANFPSSSAGGRDGLLSEVVSPVVFPVVIILLSVDSFIHEGESQDRGIVVSFQKVVSE